jgi:hypothetical protein
VKTNPDTTALLVERPITLQVGVANGQFPVAKARILFTVDAGQLDNGSASKIVETLGDGIATATWLLASDPTKPGQHATAELLIPGQDTPVAGRYLPVHFSAQLALASEISYDPADCPDLLAAKAYTVQDAIDTLCRRAHGGGCCVTVGLAGEFETLDLALRTLLKEDRRDICICLLPGNHELNDGLSVTGTSRHHVLIHGAGPASRLILKDQAFIFQAFGSLALQDFTLVSAGDPRSIVFQNCLDLRLTRMDIVGPSALGTSLINISNGLRLLIESSRLLASGTDSEQLKLVLERLPSLVPYRGIFRDTASIDGSLADAAEGIGALSPEERKKMLSEITKLARSNDLANFTQRQQIALNKLRAGISRDSRSAILVNALEQLATTLRAATPAFALALDNFEDVSLIDNRLRGRITVFGESDDMPDLNSDLMHRLSAALKAGAVSFDGGGSLILERNDLQGLRMSAKVLKDVVDNAKGVLAVWDYLQVSNNRIDSELDHYPGLNCAFNGNVLTPQADVGVLFSSQAKVIGNFSQGEYHLFVAGANPENFGNGTLNVVAI